MRILSLVAASLFLLGGAALAQSPAPAGAQAYIISPADGATVTSPVTVRFGLTGMGVAPAGIDKANTGHHHLLIDRPLPTGEDLEYSLPAEDGLRHFGGGQTEATLDLEKGRHTLQILLGDHNHVPHVPPVASAVVTITVE
ncbi:MAG: rod shape-determining protein RodA [Minwuia thermotolerans]|nr:MAG: rod shape-determining protein RodA [Minwuia thermotolerans]